MRVSMWNCLCHQAVWILLAFRLRELYVQVQKYWFTQSYGRLATHLAAGVASSSTSLSWRRRRWVCANSVTVSVSGLTKTHTRTLKPQSSQKQPNLDVGTNIARGWSFFLYLAFPLFPACFLVAYTMPPILWFFVPPSLLLIWLAAARNTFRTFL